MQPNSEDHDGRIRPERSLCIQVLVLNRNKGKDSIHHNAEPNSAETMMNAIVSINLFSICRAVPTWYLERRHGKSCSKDQVSGEARFSKSVDVGQCFATRPESLLEQHGITTTFANSAMRDDPPAEAKVVLGDSTIFGPIHDARVSLPFGRRGIQVLIDSAGGDGSKSWVVISRELDTYVTEISEGSKQSVYLETATNQDASSSIEKPVALVIP